MEEQKKKFNPYLIIVIILVLAVGVFAYDHWVKEILPGSKNTDNSDSTTPQVTKVDTAVTADDLQIGKADAPVTIVEYFSYLCGYCKTFETTTKPKIMENYITTGKVRLILRPFPPIELGEAVLCANEQGKLLEFHSYLFAHNDKITSVDDIKTLAKNFGLDATQFNQCLDSTKYKIRTELWYNQGMTDFQNAKVATNQRGTPAFFINGTPLIGDEPYENFVKVIDEKLNQ